MRNIPNLELDYTFNSEDDPTGIIIVPTITTLQKTTFQLYFILTEYTRIITSLQTQ